MTPLEAFKQFIDSLSDDFKKTYIRIYEYNGQIHYHITTSYGNSRSFQIGFDIEKGYIAWHDIDVWDD
jgi:hypothetical protein